MAKATSTIDDIDTSPELPQLPVESARVQHPALDGDVQGEIDHRTADPSDEPGRFRKVFHLGGLGFGRHDHPAHLANAAEVLGDAIRRGLHPKGDVHLVDAVEHDEPRSQRTALTYEVDVVPAVVDTDAASTLTPNDVALAAAAARKEG
jgi:hypothetical protein